MINIFDLSAGMSGRKLLTDKARPDGTPVNGGLSDVVKKVSDPGCHQIEDKKLRESCILLNQLQVINESRASSTKISGGTPMKMLIAREMSKEMKPLQKPPTVVARLMGLDALPTQQLATIAQRVDPELVMHNSSTTAGTICTNWKQGNIHHETLKPSQCHNQPTTVAPTENMIYRDVYEVQQQPSILNRCKDEALSREKHTDTSFEKRMSIVRQKFLEAKRLATNEKLSHSKEFQDALEVLSSNRDAFLKLLEEPDSLFSTHTIKSQTVPTPSQSTCITVLKPLKIADMGAVNLLDNHHLPVEAKRQDKSKFSNGCNPDHLNVEGFPRRTKIVVLKPSIGKFDDAKATTVLPKLPQTLPEKTCLFDEAENEEGRQSRMVAKENAQYMRESLSSSHMDETIFSSVLSNGYVGDESSFIRSDDEWEEECGNLSDSGFATPISQHSWDYQSRINSPRSQHSLCQSLFSPESSVIREAKKRLSERWVRVSSNQRNQEGRQEWRNGSTLGEMLAFSKANGEEKWDEMHAASSSRLLVREHDLKLASPHFPSNLDEVGCHVRSLNLQRSKSLPMSSSVYQKVESDMKGPESQIATSILSKDKEKSKLKGGKSIFKEKVSNFFLSMSKKSTLGKPSPSSLPGQSDKGHGIAEHIGKRSNDPLHFWTDHSTFENPSHNFEKLQIGNRYLSTNQDRQNQMTSSTEKHLTSEFARGKVEHHTQRLHLEHPYGETSSKYAADSASCQRAISRSPPIESVARSLVHDGSIFSDRIKTNSLKHSTNFLKADVEEKERILFVQSLLSLAGLGTETSSTFLVRWHSLESPLNPALLYKFMEHKEWTSCRDNRSYRRLLFDCVNAALLEISWTWVSSNDWLRTSSWNPATISVTEDVQKLISEWFSNDKVLSFSYGDTNTLEVDAYVKKEVSGKRCCEMMGSEIAEIGMLIEGQVTEELVGEALDDLILWWLQ